MVSKAYRLVAGSLVAIVAMGIVSTYPRQANAVDNVPPWCHTFNTDLYPGSRGEEVVALQRVLRGEGFESVINDANGFFGPSTALAVKGFQEKYRADILTPAGLTSGTGYVLWRTRAKMNILYGCSGDCVVTVKVASNVPTSWLLGNPTGSFIYSPQYPASVASATYSNLPRGTYNIIAAKNVGGNVLRSVTPASASEYAGCGRQVNFILNYVSSPVPPNPTSSLTIVSPNGGETFLTGDVMNIRWTPSSIGVGTIQLVNQNPVAGLDNVYTIYSRKVYGYPINFTGSFLYTITSSSVRSGSYKVRAFDNQDAEVALARYIDSSDAPFQITTSPTIPPTPPPSSTQPMISSVSSKGFTNGHLLAGQPGYIVGSGFLATNILKLGTALIKVASSDGKNITFTVPSLTAGTYSISISNANGTTAPEPVVLEVIAPPVGNNVPVGYFDSLSCTLVQGWSCDPDSPTAPVSVLFYMDKPIDQGGILVGKVGADVTREAGVASWCGGNPRHGFSLSTPAQLKTGAHYLYAYAVDQQNNAPTLVNGSPKKLECVLRTEELPK